MEQRYWHERELASPALSYSVHPVAGTDQYTCSTHEGLSTAIHRFSHHTPWPNLVACSPHPTFGRTTEIAMSAHDS